jgi:hypothetical protein
MSNFYRFFSLLFICCATFKLLLLLWITIYALYIGVDLCL